MERKNSFFCFLFFLLTISFLQNDFCTSINFQSKDSVVQITQLPKGVSIYQLNNGLKVLLIENPSLPMIGVNVAVKVGSAYETFSTSGMSHFLEHLLFNGTTTRTQKQLYDDVDRIGGYNNASTSEFYTNFMMVTPADNFKKGMEIQADMLFNSTLPVDKFQKEKGIVLEEISKSLVNPQEQAERNTISILYDKHALSLPTLGTYSTIQAISRDDVYSFYKNNYVPNNMILSAIGNFQTKNMLSLINEVYGKYNPGLVNRESNAEWNTGINNSELFQKQTLKIFNRFYDGEEFILQLIYPLPLNKSDEFFELLNIVLEKNKFEIQSALKTEFPAIIKSIKLSTRLSPIKNFLEATIILTKETYLNLIANSVSTKLKKIDFKLSDDVIKSEITKAKTDFIKNLEKPHMFGIYNSNKLVLNEVEEVFSVLNENRFYVPSKELEEFKVTSPDFVISQSPSSKKENTVSETQSNIKAFVNDSLGNNLIVVQNEMNNLLAIHYLVKHKSFFESKYGKDASKILHDCLEQRFKSEANVKISSKFGFSFTVNDNPMIPMDDIYLHPDFGYIRVEGLANDIAGAINFLNSQLKNFVPTENEFKKSKEKFKSIALMSMSGDKSRKLFDSLYKAIIYEPELYSSDKVELTFENLIAFTKEYFNPANMIISVVSSASSDTIYNLFNTFNDTLLRTEPNVYIPSLKLNKNEIKIEKIGGGSERSYIFWGFVKQIDKKESALLQALSLVLSNQIIFDIREKQGLAYNMSAGIEVVNDKALFFISQGTRPKNIDKLFPQYPKFFLNNAIDTLTQEDLDKSINMYLGRMMFRRLSSINQAFYLGSSFYFNKDFNYDKQFLDELKKIKIADLKNISKKYLKVENPILLIVR